MKDYQPTKNNPYTLPKELYRRVLYLVRDYARIRLVIENLDDGGLYRPKLDEQAARMGGYSDPTAQTAIKRIRLMEQVQAVDKALTKTPPEYREGILKNITEYERFPDVAHLNTWKRHKAKFIYEVANNLYEI